MDESTKEALANFSKALADVPDIFHKVAGPVAQEFGLFLGDKEREYRLRNLAKMLRRLKQIADDAGIEPKRDSTEALTPGP